jgi:DNA polymerase-1
VRADGKGRIFLIDTMSFIFRAYHAMARQRPMSTKTGLPTAATYVFVNMLRKLRDDFSPEYLAAVFDVGAPTIRNQQAEAITTIRKFDIKTQTFKESQYGGYKANRAEMPPDLAQQIPYIRRALEGYRIPILQLEGYEADDVIGTSGAEGGSGIASRVRGVERQRHAAVGERQGAGAESAEGQSDLRCSEG